MKVMMYSFAAVLLIAVGSHFVLDQIGFSSEERMSGASTRLDDASK